MRFVKGIYLNTRFYYVLAVVICMLTASYQNETLFLISKVMLLLAFMVVLVDYTILYLQKEPISLIRRVPEQLSLGDENYCSIRLVSQASLPLTLKVIDELPFQLQERDFTMIARLASHEKKTLEYKIRPLTRGVYQFGYVNVFCSSPIGLVSRRLQLGEVQSIKVMPSIIQMKKMELLALEQSAIYMGVKKIRKIGTSFEFEQIRQYVPGDDYRHINWKATGRSMQIMVNQYEDEKSQPVYSIIDNSRNMLMPFNGLSLLDHAINTTLAISNVCLKKYDKAGLITFSTKVNSYVKAGSDNSQLRRIINGLYNEQEAALEANYEYLYAYSKEHVKNRSLIFLYCNFESQYALDRVIPILRKLNSSHLLVVIFFENSEVAEMSLEKAPTLEKIYHNTIALNYISEKKLMVQKLNKLGIQTIYTRPEDLSISTLNKYLELKARGLI